MRIETWFHHQKFPFPCSIAMSRFPHFKNSQAPRRPGRRGKHLAKKSTNHHSLNVASYRGRGERRGGGTCNFSHDPIYTRKLHASKGVAQLPNGTRSEASIRLKAGSWARSDNRRRGPEKRGRLFVYRRKWTEKENGVVPTRRDAVRRNQDYLNSE